MSPVKYLATVAIVIASLAACAPAAKEDPAAAAMRAQADAESAMLDAVDTLIKVWDTNETDRLDAIAVADYKRTAPDQNADSLEELKAFIDQVHGIYADFSITNDAAAAGPDGVFVQWTVTATIAGEADDPAAGRSINVTGISRYQFVDGKIAKELVVFDTGTLMGQLDTDEMPHAAQ